MTHKISVPAQAPNRHIRAKTGMQSWLLMIYSGSHSAAAMTVSNGLEVKKVNNPFLLFSTLIIFFNISVELQVFLMSDGTPVVNNIIDLKSTTL